MTRRPFFPITTTDWLGCCFVSGGIGFLIGMLYAAAEMGVWP